MINENNYETYLMSYIDNELSADQRAAVEAFVSTNTKYAKALSVFKTTKLEAPFIEMKDKIFLYRFPLIGVMTFRRLVGKYICLTQRRLMIRGLPQIIRDYQEQ